MKIKSSLLALILLGTLVLNPSLYGNEIEYDYFSLVEKSFPATKSKLSVLNIQLWGQINTKEINEKQLLKIHNHIISLLGIKNNPQINNQYPDFRSSWQKEEIAEDIYMEVTVQSFSEGTFAGILVYTKDFSQGRIYYDKVKQIASIFNLEEPVGITATGTLEGQITQKKQTEIIENILYKVKALPQEGMQNYQLISISAYTFLCGEFLPVGDKKINLNIAMRYHFVDDKTYIYIGAPLIFEEY